MQYDEKLSWINSSAPNWCLDVVEPHSQANFKVFIKSHCAGTGAIAGPGPGHKNSESCV